MSDNHARLFASAVPGNGSSDIIGENGNGHEGETDVTQETRDVGPYTPDQSDNGQRGTSPVGQTGDVDDGEPNEIEQECIEQMDDLVENFRCNEITKLKALSSIISILDLNPSRSERAKDAAVEYYAKTLDEVQALSSSAVRRGTIAENAFDSRRQSPNPTESRRPTNQDAEIDELISQISRDSKRSRGQSSGTESDNELDLDGDRTSNKKRRVFESQMPWYTKEEEARRSGNKDCEESRRILHLFARDYKVVKQWIQTSRTAPLGFPGSEWDNIIRGQAVNLDAVFSSLHHVSAPKENVGRVGHTEISLGRSEPAKKVQTSGEWTSAWNATIKAVKFAFPHREQELREYGEYIEGHFSAKVISAHRRIILYDIAIRNEVGGGQNALLTDSHRFSRLFSAIVMPDGIESEHARLGSKRTTGKNSKTEICNRFNSINGCRNTAEDCRFRHACKKCKRVGHGEKSCDVKENSSA